MPFERWFYTVPLRLRSLFRRRQVEKELDEELRYHVERQIEENIANGLTPEEARYAALRAIGGIERRKEECRDMRSVNLIGNLRQDLRYGARMLLKRPGFTLMVALTLALGIGANTAIFSVVYAVLIEPLPYERPEQLTIVWSNFQTMGASRAPASGIEMREIRERSQSLQDLAGIWVGNGTLMGDPEPEQIKVALVTTNFFSVLGAQPLLGRAFLPEEQGAGGRRAIILSHDLWKRRYGGDLSLIGRTLRFQDSPTVVGIMPENFQLRFPPDASVPLDIEAWIPFPYDIYQLPRDDYYIRLLGRLKPGVTVEQANAEMPAVAQHLRDHYSEFAGENLKLEVVPLRGDAVRDVQPALWALFTGAGLVLLIACVNVANLLLTRANVRRREIALRAALGASQWRIIRQLLCESLLYCILGGVLGLVIGWWGLKLLLGLRPSSLAWLSSVKLNLIVLGFVTTLALLSGLLFSLAPALETLKLNLIDALKEAGRSAAGSGRQRTHTFLIMSEIALGFVLLVGAGLMLRTLAQLQKVDPGFNADRALTFELNLTGAGFSEVKERTNFATLWEEKLTGLPGVEAAGAISHLPLDDYPNWYSPYAPEGVSEEQKRGLTADHRAITPGYFQAIGAQLVAGRWFDKQDTAATRNVVVIDDLLARQTWPGKSAIGKKIRFERFVDGGFRTEWAEVVGVVKHIHHHSLAATVRGQIYIPYPQSAREHLSYVVKTKGDPLALALPIRRGLRQLHKDMALTKVRPLRDYLNRATAPAKFTAWLASIFSGLALLLAMVGIYGVIAYSVSQRTQEIGVRRALGAQSRDIVALVVARGMRPALVGMAIGVAAAFALTRLMTNLLFEVSATDPITFAAGAALLSAVSLLACYLPARRAVKVDPIVALKYE
jgi:putative ABC transport system permease protein